MPLPRYDAEVWSGGFFELAIESCVRSTPRLNLALQTLWQHPSLVGCFASRDVNPADQTLIPPRPITSDDDSGHSYGVAQFQDGKRIACGTLVLREIEGSSDWLVLYLPMGSLSTAFDVGGYPFDHTQPKGWLPEVEQWFAEIALWLSQQIEFQLGLIGFEVLSITEINTSKLLREGGVPVDRSFGYVFGNGMNKQYFPSNYPIREVRG